MDISVVIPAYNSAGTIGRLIESLLNQTVLPAEIIIADGNSDDSTRSVCESFASSRVRFITNPQGHETGTNRNLGVKAATCDHIIFLDSDCVADKNLISVYSIQLEKYDCIAGNVLILNPGEFSYKAYMSERYLLNNHMIDGFVTGVFFWVMNFGIRKDKLVDFPDTSYSEDMVFIEELFNTGIKVKYCKQAVAYHTYPETELDFFKKRLRTNKGFIMHKDRITDVAEGSYFFTILKLLEMDTAAIKGLLREKKICFDPVRKVVFDGKANPLYHFQDLLIISAAVAVIESMGDSLDMSYEELLSHYNGS